MREILVPGRHVLGKTWTAAALACTVLVLLLCAATASAAAWDWKLPMPTGNAMRAVARGANAYVAVGNGGSILFSNDGSSWSLARAGSPDEALDAITYGSGVFVAVGQGGAVWRSTDGLDWTRSTNPTATALRAVTYGSAGFVACGELTLITSPDGVTWTEVDTGVTPGVFGPRLQGVAFGNGVYAVWIDIDPIGAASSAAVLTSVDAATWTLVPLGPFDGHNGVLFARGFVHADGRFVALATSDSLDSLSLTSIDGSHWSAGTTPTYEDNTVYFKSGAFDPASGRYIALAGLDDPPLPLDAYPVVMSSADGLDWMGEGFVDHIPLVRLAQAGDIVLGLPNAGGGMYERAGASTWSAITPVSPAWQLSSILADGVAVIAAGRGAGDTAYSPSGTLIASFDGGGTWSKVLTVEGTNEGGGFTGLASGASHRVAVGTANNSVTGAFVPVAYSSTDGATWTSADLSGVDVDVSGLYGVAYGNNVFVASAAYNGDAVEVLKSADDGATWQSQATNLSQPLGRIVFADDGFAAVSAGFSSAVFFSSDAITWSERATGTSASYLTDIAYRDGTYVALGLAFGPGGNVSKLVVSTDGVSWEPVDAAPTDILSLSTSADGFVATGAGGNVYRAADGRTWTSSWSGSADWITASAQLPDGRLAVTTVRGGVLIGAASDRIFADGFETGSRRP
jgi:hypothetical protein